MSAKIKHIWSLIWVAGAIVLLCQAIRWYLTTYVDLPLQVFSTTLLDFNLRYSENRGMNFGLFAADTWVNQAVLASLALAVCAVLAFVFLRKGRVSYAIAGGMVVGGGLSNVLERITTSFVFDYVNTTAFGFDNPFNYNAADIFIVLPILWWALLSD